MNELIHGDCFDIDLGQFDCVFADPPDNLGLKYNEYSDNLSEVDYVNFLDQCIYTFTEYAPIVWISFNSHWLPSMGSIVADFLDIHSDWGFKPCVQTFTFGQHNHHDLGNNHRPLWRFKHKDASLYPDQIRVPSWRQLNGDKRADPRGKVPGDVFDVPRVTGNSKQRRSYHPTQLHEDLIKRCILLSTKEGDTVLDPFAGTGTTLRVCKEINRQCTLIEIDKTYCDEIAKEHDIPVLVQAT